MNKLLKTVLSVLLCFTLLLSASSCDLVERVKGLFDEDKTEGPKEPERVVVEVPEGYTGGSRYAQPKYYEIYWFETVAEAKDAISRLEAHGSTVYKSALFDYSSENYDVKVMLKIDRTYVEPLKEGQNPFDRKAGEVYIRWFLFDEYISIDELVYMKAEDVCRIHHVVISVDGEKCEIENPELLTVDHGLLEFGLDWPENAAPPSKYVVYYDGEFIFSVDINGEKGLLPKDVAKEMSKTATIVGNTVSTRKNYYDSSYEGYTFETYDELISAIETLKAHGSTINPSYVFDCEGMVLNGTHLDCKYVIIYPKRYNPPLQEGQNFFERKIEGAFVVYQIYDTFYPVFDKNSTRMTFEMANNRILEMGPIQVKEIVRIEDEALLKIEYGLFGAGLDLKNDYKPNCFAISYDGVGLFYVDIYEYNRYQSLPCPSPEFALEFVKTIRYIH